MVQLGLYEAKRPEDVRRMSQAGQSSEAGGQMMVVSASLGPSSHHRHDRMSWKKRTEVPCWQEYYSYSRHEETEALLEC